MKLIKDRLSEEEQESRSSALEGFQLGDALIKPSLNRIEVKAKVHQVEPKVMQVLLVLCERPGHVVARESLLLEVWAQSGGDDYLLNRAISELRKIFADSAQKPDYIETIRKTGYRLLAPIKPIASAALVASQQSTPQNKIDASNSHEGRSQVNEGVFEPRLKSPRRNYALALAVFALVVVALITRVTNKGIEAEFSMADYQVYPVTSQAGREYDPALSPDGSRIAYIADDENGNSAVFAKMLRGEKNLKLSRANENARHPQWMPDGQRIVYASLSGSTLQLISVSPLGGARRTLYLDNSAFGFRGMSISPDGKLLAYSKRVDRNSPLQIWLVSIADGEKRQFTFPEAASLGDIDPLFTPDGLSLVYVRGTDEVTKDLYLQNIDDGKLKRLTFDNRKINGIAWSPDGSKLLFTSTRSGLYRLWSIGLSGKEEASIAMGMEAVQRPASALNIEAIVFEDWKHQANLITVDLSNDVATLPEAINSSTRWDSNPSISPDAKTIVFASDRGGPYALWLLRNLGRDNEEMHEWINLGGAFIDNPSWSPDGSRVVFDASPNGVSQLYIIEKGAGKPKQLKLGLGESDNRSPAWSRDSKRIYFESNRSGTWQLYAWNVEAEVLQKINMNEGRNPQESVDGKWILFTSNDGLNIQRCLKETCLRSALETEVSINNKDSSLAEILISDIAQQDSTNWTPSSDGVYFIRRAQDQLPALVRYSYAAQEIEIVAQLSSGYRGWGMSLAPDEEWLVFTEFTQQDSDIRIARP